MTHAARMAACEVVEIIDWLNASKAVYQVNGGWGVDALAGRETRAHRDLDVFLDSAVVPRLVAWLACRGYQTTEDWRPSRLELASARGRVDVHPMDIQPNGDGIQHGPGDETYAHTAQDRTSGVIGGRDVVVATVARLRELREGYVLRPVDLHDLGVLDDL